VDRRGHFVVKIRLDEFCGKHASQEKSFIEGNEENKEGGELSA
jgi:hypothetical protein